MKQLLACVLTLAILLSMLPHTLPAAYAQEEASADNALAGKIIACVGDSITAAYGVTKDENDYVTLLAEQLGMDYIRLGASGTTLCTDGSRTCNIGKLTEANLQGADIVTIAMGINDFCAAAEGYYELGDIHSTDSSTIYGAARMWCERIEELRKNESLRHTQFYFLTPIITSWNSSVTTQRDWDQSKANIHGYTLRDLCNAIIDVAVLYDVAVMDLNLLSGMYYVDAEDNNTAVFGGDGVHPGVKGHEMMAAAMANILLQNDLRDDHTHTFGSWITTTWPSCSAGEQKRVCTICSATQSRTLESGDSHSYRAVVTLPTYIEQGYTTYTCSRCGDSYVSDYTAPIAPNSYRWEMRDNALVSVTAGGNAANALTQTSGSITGGTLANARYCLQEPIRLRHDKSWVIEWRSSGNWDGMLLGSTMDSSVQGLTYLFRYAPMDFLALGEYTGAWNNYGIVHAIDMTASHVFRLENRVGTDGTNTVYLLVDGREIDGMYHYYVGGTNQNKTVNWANGKDIVFSNIGTSSHPVSGMRLEYLQVWENGHVHTYESAVTAPTCTAAGYTTYTCACGDSYTDDEAAATGHSYANGICTDCGAEDPDYVEPAERFDLFGANVILGNDLTMNFCWLTSHISGTDCYAEIVRYNPDGTTVTTNYPFSEWSPYANGTMYLITLDGLAAKQMSDRLEVTIYTGDGVPVSNTWVDSIRDYAIRQLNNSANAGKVYTVVADMLNYGAAAQIQFAYNTGDLANATMTDAHKAYATASLDFADYTNNQVVGDNFFGTILALETNIQMGVFFKGVGYEGCTAKVSYRDHNGNTVSYEVAGKDFDTRYITQGMYGILVDTLVAGDVYQLVTVEVYDGDTRLASAVESMESYLVRQSASALPIYEALMKFLVSSYNYSH